MLKKLSEFRYLYVLLFLIWGLILLAGFISAGAIEPTVITLIGLLYCTVYLFMGRSGKIHNNLLWLAISGVLSYLIMVIGVAYLGFGVGLEIELLFLGVAYTNEMRLHSYVRPPKVTERRPVVNRSFRLLGLASFIILFVLLYSGILVPKYELGTIWKIVNYLVTGGLGVWAGVLYVRYAIKNMVDLNEENLATINRLVEAEKEKNEALRENQLKTSFLANMSHELRTPLNAILGMNSLIKRDTESGAIRTYSAGIEDSGQYLLGVVNDILDFSKIESRSFAIKNDLFETTHMLNRLCDVLEERAKANNLSVGVNVSPRIPSVVCGDELRISQVMVNIIGNACKYTKEGAVILNADYEEGCFNFSVSDTGIGMTEEEIKNIFVKFSRFGKADNQATGTGLGMPIAKLLTDAMNGTISVESEVNKGSTFKLSLPIEAKDESPIGPLWRTRSSVVNEQTVTSVKIPGKRLLVVDDIETNLLLIKDFLKYTEMEIDCASKSDQAVELIENARYDLILSDYLMPEMDGIELLKHIRQSEQNSKTPVVVLTANALSGSKDYFLSQGFAGYISKPIDLTELNTLITEMLV